MKIDADVAILGAGFGGSLTALLLARIGLRPVLIDRGSHPRFAIGESSTPSANLILRDLAARYDLPRLAPLAKYGTWQQAHPQLVCGPKRGFSYFKQHPGEAFQPGADHAHELLVAASPDLEHADTHWLRSDVDGFLASEAVDAGVPYFDRTSVSVSRHRDRFHLAGERNRQPVEIVAPFLIDASGESGVVLKSLGVGQRSPGLLTHSRAIFAHFSGLAPWREFLAANGGRIDDHPFDCDTAALHQVFDEGWMWQLRFNNGVTSAGFALDTRRSPLDPSIPIEEEWSRLLQRYPSVAAQFAAARLVDPPGGLCRTSRLQRRADAAAGDGWAALPHTAGFVDALHSSGIAHSLCGIERLIGLLEQHWGRPTLTEVLAGYSNTVLDEVDFIDEMVACCFDSLTCFDLFAASVMLYFAAVTTFERRRLAGGKQVPRSFLCADDPELRRVVRESRRRLLEVVIAPTPAAVSRFQDDLAAAIAPFNTAGLFRPEVPNMYRHTAVRG